MRKLSYKELEERYRAAERSDTLNMLALHDVVNGRVEWVEAKTIDGYTFQHGYSRLTAGHGGLLITKFTQPERNHTSVGVTYLDELAQRSFSFDREEDAYLSHCIALAQLARQRAFDAERAA